MCNTITGLSNVVCKIGEVFSYILPVLVALGVLYFVYGVVMYMIADGEEAKKKGKDSVIYGLIGLAVIVAMWGLVNIVLSTFNLENGGSNEGFTPTNDQIKDLLPK